MLVGVVLLLCACTVPLAGGRIARLAEIQFRSAWTAIAAILIQVLIVSVLPGGWPAVHTALHGVSYALLAFFVVANLRLPGMWVLGIGGALNAIAIAANGGVMPASRAALSSAGLAQQAEGFSNSVAVTHPHLLFLGDVFAVPASWPVHNVFSVGDVLIILGVTLLMHGVAGSPVRLPRVRLNVGPARVRARGRGAG